MGAPRPWSCAWSAAATAAKSNAMSGRIGIFISYAWWFSASRASFRPRMAPKSCWPAYYILCPRVQNLGSGPISDRAGSRRRRPGLPASLRAYNSAVRLGIPISASRFFDHPFYTPASPAGRAGGGGEREPDGDAGAALLRIDARIARIALRSVMKAMIFIGPPQFEQTSGSTS